MAWIMVDIEADGPIPGDYSMICLGAIVVAPELKQTFYGRLKQGEAAQLGPQSSTWMSFTGRSMPPRRPKSTDCSHKAWRAPRSPVRSSTRLKRKHTSCAAGTVSFSDASRTLPPYGGLLTRRATASATSCSSRNVASPAYFGRV